MGLHCRAGSGRGLLSAMEGTVTFALMVHDSPKIHGLHEIIKTEVAEEWTLGFISASLQAGHGKREADLSKTHSDSADATAPVRPQHPRPSATLLCHSCWAQGATSPRAEQGQEHLQCPELSPACGTHVTP